MSETMLIVDDLDINRDLLTEMFKENFNIITASNGVEALSVIEEWIDEIDIVILDLMMPKMTGYEVLEKRVKMSQFSEIPVIVITVCDEVEDQMKAFRFGANDYITRPFEREIVTYRVRNALLARKRVSEVIREREEYQVRSQLDLMTGLYNKATTQRLISNWLTNAGGSLAAMLMFDIDNFKAINDSKGHIVGDRTISMVADLIATQFRKGDIVGRIGGDEFVALMVDLPDKDVARKKAENIARLLRYRANLALSINVSLSVGLAFNNNEIDDYETLFNEADKALYQAKSIGKGQYAEAGKENHLHLVDGIEKVVLLSNYQSSVLSTFKYLNDANVQLITISNLDELAKIIEDSQRQMKVVYVDLTCKEIMALLPTAIEMLQSYWIKVIPICHEATMEQYRYALQYPITGILSYPLEVNGLINRVYRDLK